MGNQPAEERVYYVFNDDVMLLRGRLPLRSIFIVLSSIFRR
jgi:hypothetical protein